MCFAEHYDVTVLPFDPFHTGMHFFPVKIWFVRLTTPHHQIQSVCP